MPYADLPGVHLWYTDTGGNGVPVILMHAGSGTSESWVYQLPAFTAAGYRCIAYDRRGMGRSQPDPAGEQPGYVSDDLHRLADHLGLGPMHVAATAAGGGGAVDFALTHPDRLRSLVVADSGMGGVPDQEYLDYVERARPPALRALPVELRELSASYRGADPEGTRRWIEIERASRAQGQHGTGQRRHNELTFALLEKLRVPTLVVAGDADQATPPSQLRMFAAHIPNCRFATVPEAGHAAFWEQPETWNRIVLEFIERH